MPPGAVDTESWWVRPRLLPHTSPPHTSVKMEAAEDECVPLEVPEYLSLKEEPLEGEAMTPLEERKAITPPDTAGVPGQLLLDGSSLHCPVCKKKMRSRSRLHIHLRTHTGEMPYVCDVCLKGFALPESLANHKLIHAGKMLYECDICLMGFSRSDIYMSHMRTHTGEARYKCEICLKGFSRSDTFMNHKRTQHGEMIFRCDT